MQAATNVFFGVALAIFATAQATVPSVDRAVCVFTPGNTVTGHVSFSRRSPATTTTVTYSLNGLSVGAHNWHVHLYGDISQDSSMGSTGGHFVGQPTAPRTEIANFASPGTTITADANGFAESSFTDPELKLSGLNSIVGRSIVIHGDSPTNTGVRVAMCVIGIAEEGGLAGTATVTEPVTVLEASKRTLTARITGKRVSSTNGPIQKYGLGTTDEYAGTATFSGSARVTEKHSGLVASIAMLGTVADANRVPTGTVTVVETIDSNGDRLVSLRYTLEWGKEDLSVLYHCIYSAS
jgi:Cu-Zn family superoxide dismutase